LDKIGLFLPRSADCHDQLKLRGAGYDPIGERFTIRFRESYNGDVHSDGSTGLTTAQTYMTGFDFANVWQTRPGDYPTLRGFAGSSRTKTCHQVA